MTYQDYSQIAICSICKKLDVCRLDYIDNRLKCISHGGINE